jgi:hypothetical protein
MTPTELRANAERMRKQAEQSKDPAVRQSYLKLAGDWDGLARDAEELQRRLTANPSSSADQNGTTLR